MSPRVQQIIQYLGLEPLEFEGGYFRRTYTSSDQIDSASLPGRYTDRKTRHFASAIYYLLAEGMHSRLHMLPTDEMFHFYAGDPVYMLQLHPDRTAREVIIGNDVLNGHEPQVLVPRGTWQGCRLVEGGEFALMGATLSPAFDISDFRRPGNVEDLVKMYPESFSGIIRELS